MGYLLGTLSGVYMIYLGLYGLRMDAVYTRLGFIETEKHSFISIIFVIFGAYILYAVYLNSKKR